MRKFLTKLPHSTLIAIARDLGKVTNSAAEAINHIVEQAAGYRWSISDVKARWQL